MEYRHELKYVVTAARLALLESRIRGLIPLDVHAGEAGMYQIRSLYFDDYYNSGYVENEIGTDPREKFRVRIYNGDRGRISLELKSKEHGMTKKQSCLLTEEQCQTLMAGQLLSMNPEDPPVLKKLNLLMRTRLLKPKVIVEYDRVPYAEPLGNTRITLDQNMASSDEIHRFLEPQIRRRPIMGTGQHILEVKYDEFLPDYIYRNLQLNSLRQTAFSKYYLCRRYTLKGSR